MASSEIEKLERLVRENPKVRQFAILADAYRKDGQFERALEVLTLGLEHHPDYVSARVVLGRVLVAMGDKPKAREAFARVIALDAENVIALKALADLAEEVGESSEALRWSGQLLAVDPGNEEAIKQTERLAAAAPPEPRLSGIVPLEMSDVAEQVAPMIAPEAEGAPAEEAPVKTVEITIPTAPMISVQNLAPVFNPTTEPLTQEPEPLPLVAPISDEAQTEATAQMVRPMEALEPTAYEGPADATTERLAGIDPTGMSEAEIAGIGAASGFEPTSGPLDTREIAAIPLAGLEGASEEVVVEREEVGLEREDDLVLGGSASNEYQESSDAETLRRSSGANEFQEDSVAETLRRRSGVNEFQAPDDGLDFIVPPTPSAAPQAPQFTPASLPAEDLEPAVAEPEPVVTEAMAELYASQGHLVAALEVYHELAMRNPNDPRYADRIVELEMFVGGSESVSAVQTFEAADLPEEPAPEEIGESHLEVAPMPVDMVEEPPAAPVAESIAAMELTDGADGSATGRGWHAGATGGTPVRSWLANVFAEALPAGEPKGAPPAEPKAESALPEVVVESDVTPRGAPTRPASGSFSLTNVFGDGGAAPAPKSGSFDDFFGAPAPTSAPSEPGAPSIRTRPSTATPGAEDDLSSFQDWLKGLKK